MNEIEVLRAVDFDWATRLLEVWDDAAWDVPELHAEIRDEFARKLDQMCGGQGEKSPLGWVIVGGGGVGKTHLLGAFRREAFRRKAAFVLVDMTDVRDFWETVLQGYIDSLQQSVGGETYQYECLLRNIIEQLGPNKPVGRILSMLSERKSTDLAGDIKKVIDALGQVHRRETLRYHDVVRALICLNSDHSAIASLGMTWLQGQRLEEGDRTAFGFSVAQERPRKIIEALSWFMGLSGPTVLAFDQLDPIVTQLHYRKEGETSPEEESVANAIIAEIGGGLGALRDTTENTLAVVSCVESTWEILQTTVLRTFVDRFEEPCSLSSVGQATVARAVVQNRLSSAFNRTDFTPAYPTWPFRPKAFESVAADSPREILKKCDRHLKECVRNRRVSELDSFGTGPLLPGRTDKEDRYREIDRIFQDLRSSSDPAVLMDEKQEDPRIAPSLQAALVCLLHETELPPGIVGRVDSEFTGGKATRPLHARLRLVFEQENEREEHFCLRSLEHTNAKAYQARLKSALTQSGIDRSLPFRRLCLVRSQPLPGGAETQRLTEKFTEAGGIFIKPSDDELRTINAVYHLKLRGEPDFEDWLKSRKPISKLGMIKKIVPSPLFEAEVDTGESRTPSGGQEKNNGKPDRPPDEPKQFPNDGASLETPRNQSFPLGRTLAGGRIGNTVAMPVELLEKHLLGIGGAGSGKSVLLKRVIEEAVLMGIPSIVIDCANDMAALDEKRPSRPDGWLPEDDEKARRYHETLDYVLWTPGRESGNPIALEPLPDLAAFAQDVEELDAAVAMVRESLTPVVAAGQSAASKNKVGVLSSALRYFAHNGAGSLEDFVELLNDLPAGAGLGVANEPRLAKQMADSLKSAIETNPLLRSNGTPLDPAVLFGDADRGRVRISVINFLGLPGIEAQRVFINQLAMTLFAWIKRNPEPGPRPLRGLLVIDEAKDYIPSQKASTSKESLARLVAQARKYHLGLAFATQNPREIENTIMANCSTHFYGKVNSPAAIGAVKELIAQKGGTGEDVPRLTRGQFYVHNADAKISTPTKILVPNCLSKHPDNPLDEAAVMKKAVASREMLRGG